MLIDCHEKNKPMDVDARDRCGRTPLHYALQQRHRKNFEFLLRSGADPNVADDEGSTPLHATAKSDNDSMEAFINACGDNELRVRVDVRDKLGRTPLEWAVANLLPNSVDLLLDRGADLSSFVFPTADYFAETTPQRRKTDWSTPTTRRSSSRTFEFFAASFHVYVSHLSETITRGFCRRWATKFYLEATRDSCENFINPLNKKDLFLMCLQASQQKRE
ncbi:hypothetical protein TKK_0013215 [Trichogramma kaykai]